MKIKYNLIVPKGKHTYGPEPAFIGLPIIGEGSKMGNFCSIAPGLQYIFRGKHMVPWISTYAFQARWNMPEVPINDLPLHYPITIGNDVWIAENVKILQGVTIGDGAVVATESFVTKDVPPYAMVGGYPAEIIRYRFTEPQIAAMLRIQWWNWPDDKIKKAVPLLCSRNIDKFIQEYDR